MIMKSRSRFFVLGFTAIFALSAYAATYPTRPITIVIGFSPGSGIDSITRMIGHRLEAAFNQGVVIENKPGANAALAAGYVARSAPDGYTLTNGGGFYAANPSLMKSISYDPAKDFAPVTRTGGFAYMLVVHPQVPVRTVAELVAYAKANPGKLSFATSNSTGEVAGETFKRRSGIDINHIPYKSAPPALNDVLGGQVSMMFVDITTALPHLKANTLRGLAVTAIERSVLLPDLPSLHESGLMGFDVASWDGIFAPAHTPSEIIARLNTELRKVIDDSQIKGQLAAMGFEATSSTPQELGDFAEAQRVKWAKMIKDAGIEPQ
jgi:tripartite-type tricarboxylate transporter receptor subunit TctC